jgi:hypothetical protein
MTNAGTTTLVLGGTGKTGARVASRLTGLGRSVRTAARQGADAVFDWDDPATHRTRRRAALLRPPGRRRRLRLHHHRTRLPTARRRPRGVAELYRPYGETFVLNRCFDLAVHRDRETGVVVLEYASEGRVVGTGADYANRYVSVLTITERKVTRWRDYLDPIAVFDAAGWPAPRLPDPGQGSTSPRRIA